MKLLFMMLVLLVSLDAKDISTSFAQISEKTWLQVGTWQVKKEVLTLIKPSKQYFNLCFKKNTHFLNGSISVRFKANSGRIDQGGGLMWRVQDKDNYYIARFNPLEDNFRFYIVHDGIRSELASADIKLSAGWHTMKIVQNGNHFQGYLEGKKYLDFSDTHLSKSGGVGVWTKADALTSFDTLQIQKVE